MRLSSREIMERLRGAEAQYTPLKIASIVEEGTGEMGDLCADALIRFEVANGPSFRALAEVVSVATPKRIARQCALVADLCRRRSDPDLVPMVVAAYVPARQAATLARAGVSWLDLSGNMVIRVSDRVYIERTGRPNQFPDTAPIKKVFQGTASLVGRALLLEPTGFTSLSQIVDFIERRGATIALSTVSKVLRSLEEDLLVTRGRQSISVSEPGQLLDRLAQGYAASRNKSETMVSCFAVTDVDRVLKQFSSMLRSAYVFSGFYAAQLKGLAVSSEITVRVKNMARFREVARGLGPDVQDDEEFGNLRVVETRDRLFWFNAETTDGLRVVDDLQLYLEMTVATPRGPKVADALRPRILREGARG